MWLLSHRSPEGLQGMRRIARLTALVAFQRAALVPIESNCAEQQRRFAVALGNPRCQWAQWAHLPGIKASCVIQHEAMLSSHSTSKISAMLTFEYIWAAKRFAGLGQHCVLHV